MKPLFLLFTITLFTTACNTNLSVGTAPTINVDSIANVKVEQEKIRLATQNDSILNAMAHHKADSILATQKK